MFKPLFSEPSAEATLYPGIPPWLSEPLYGWIERQLAHAQAWKYAVSDRALVERFDRLTRRGDPLIGPYADGGFRWAVQYESVNTVIEFVNFLVHSIATRHDPQGAGWRIQLANLEMLLKESGSAYTVSARKDAEGLEDRVPDPVKAAALEAMKAVEAGPLLSSAWSHAFGRTPSASMAYRDAVRAVEAAAIPVVQPKHSRATLGTVIGQMKTDADWALPIEHNNRRLSRR